jgi:F0F1-type ATP synthase gamma subunit
MKLVAAAKVRRAQEAVVNGRPFSENLIKVRTSNSSRSKSSRWFPARLVGE